MTFDIDAGRARRLERFRLALLVLVAAAIGHQVVYALRFGIGRDLSQALATDGHAISVPLLVAAAVAAGLGFVAIAAWRLGRLRSIARRIAAPTPRRRGTAPSFAERWLGLTSRVGAGTLAAFVVQENIEHLFGHGHVEGLGVLGGNDALLTIGALLVVGAFVSLAGLLIRWREVPLEEAIAAARQRHAWQRAAQPVIPRWDPQAAFIRTRRIIDRRDLGRAPPLVATT